MPVKMTRHYYEIARQERRDPAHRQGQPRRDRRSSGSEDPGNQMDYSPVEGLLHKYEMGLMYVVSTCSAHCRFCYREELIARRRSSGTTARSKKGLAKIPEVVGVHPGAQREVEANGGATRSVAARSCARSCSPAAIRWC
jgi:lysine 2,3-aminomutase